jgi:tetratricopeptide (TPR) repeat protein
MVRAAPAENRSLALTVLGVLWLVAGALTLLLAALLLALLFVGRQAASTPLPPDGALLGGAAMLLAALLSIGVARGLLARQRWAYYANIALLVLSLPGALLSVRAGTALAGLLPASLGDGTAALALLIVLGIVFVLLPLVLTILSYGDFFGPLVRFVPAFEDADHVAHYNNGIAYRDRGMWHMAAREWEAAARKKPREANYLHALGLAYARLKQFDRARDTLDAALRAAPDSPQIKESRALVDQMAAK